MSVSANEIAKLRRLVAENDACTYTDEDLTAYIEDADGVIYWAAAEICREKAAALTNAFDFSADGGTYNRGDIAGKWLKMADRYQSMGGKMNGGTIRLVKWPVEPKRRNVLVCDSNDAEDD